MVVFAAQSASATTDTTYTSSSGEYSIQLDEGLYSISMQEEDNSPVTLDPEFFFTQDSFELPVTTIPNGQSTNISGAVSGTWTVDDRFVATSNLVVEEGTTLQLLPGTKVVLGTDVRINVYGSIMAFGVVDSAIVLTNRSSSELTTPWGGIVFDQATQMSTLDHCQIIRSAGIVCDASSPVIANCTIRGSADAAILGRLHMDHSSPYNLHCSPQITGNTIEGNGRGVVFDCEAAIYSSANILLECEPAIIGNYIISNDGVGIEISSLCRKWSNEGGDATTHCNAQILGNVILNNGGPGLVAINENDWNNVGSASAARMDIEFTGNTLKRNAEAGVDVVNENIGGNYTGSICTTNIDFTENSISWSVGPGVRLESGSGAYQEFCRASFIGNVISSNLGDGVRLTGGTGSSPGQIIDNSFIGNGGSGTIISGCNASEVRSNIYAYNGSTALNVSSSAEIDIEYNDFWQNTNGDFMGSGASEYFGVIITVNANGTPSDTFYNIFEDPGLQDHFDCELMPGSPCIDAGDPNPAFYDPDGTITDIGARYYNQDLTSISSGDSDASLALAFTAFPNPFNPSTSLRFRLPEAGGVSLVIYDALGRRVRTLVRNEVYATGIHDVTWDGRDQLGVLAASGRYFGLISTSDCSASVILTLVK